MPELTGGEGQISEKENREQRDKEKKGKGREKEKKVEDIGEKIEIKDKAQSQ